MCCSILISYIKIGELTGRASLNQASTLDAKKLTKLKELDPPNKNGDVYVMDHMMGFCIAATVQESSQQLASYSTVPNQLMLLY